MSPLILAFFNFLVASCIFTLSPGIDFALVLRSSINAGHRRGVGAACGIALSTFLWGILASCGLCTAFKIWPKIYIFFKVVGALYMSWLAIKMILLPISDRDDSKINTTEDGNYHFFYGFKQGWITDALNPENGIFIITFFPQFIPNSYMDYNFLIMIFMSVILGLESFILLGALALLTLPLGTFLSELSVQRWIDRITGFIFLYLISESLLSIK